MRNLIAVILFAVLVGMSAMPLDAMADSDASTAPRLNHGKKWRIGYYEGGPYRNYPINLRTIVAGLAGLGWMAPGDIPAYQDDSDSRKGWDYLVQHVNSD